MSLDRLRIPLKDGNILYAVASQFQQPTTPASKQGWVFYVSTGTNMCFDLNRIGESQPKHYRLSPQEGFKNPSLTIVYEIQKRMREITRDEFLRVILSAPR